ncbi:MAG: CDP-diacylglycerol--glycerol-3-phosphate 3-phosphatidyltransferase [Verrucomicrobiales bacterium]|nr:CDP-diacylglycerol--glycerol-3-phosphate 3-phosphatidyltransferase [Verrucomicrobiales bacterium]
MNLPNRLTLARLILTVVFVACFHLPGGYGLTSALLVFVAASITDYFDGHLARSQGLVTNFGKLFDPLADKVLITAAFILLVERGDLPAWIAILILSREFCVTGIRQIAATAGVVLAAEKLGKHKMAWQIVTVIYFMLRGAVEEPLLRWLAPIFSPHLLGSPWVAGFIVGVTTLLTIVSGFSYFWKNRALFNDA